MEEKMANQGAIHRGNLLKISQFLWSFSSEYNIKDGPITPDDIDAAFEYAYGTTQHKLLEEIYYRWRRDRHGNNENFVTNQQKKWEDIINKSRAALERSSQRTKQIHATLQRFEVWSIKILASKSFLPSGSAGEVCADNKKPSCWSSLLNIPCACHFAKILPPLPNLPSDELGIEQDANTATYDAEKVNEERCSNMHVHDGPCSLALPPNSLTCREYVRLIRMLYLLPDDQSRCQVSQSALTWFQKEGVGLADSFKFTTHDLLALWTRSQRNTMALRHLWQIFAFSEQNQRRSLTIRGTTGSGKRLVPLEGDEHYEDDKKSRQFVARMLGNNRKVRARVLAESSHVDELVTWAVVNQTLFTFHYVRAMIEVRLAIRKRRLTGLYQPSQKRRRIESNGDQELLNACQSYVLRWFARRHLDTLAVLFLTEPDSLARSNPLVNRFCKAQVPKEIYSKLGSNVRSFAQVDSLIAQGEYQSSQKFYDVIMDLLRAMSVSVPHKILPAGKLVSVIADFDEMYESFLKGKHPVDSANVLLDTAFLSPKQSLAALLRSLPAPWADICATCNGRINASDAAVCSCCGASYHSKCCENRDIGRCRALNLIRRMWTIFVPPGILPRPEFRDNEAWTTVNITIVRKVADDGSLPQLGLSLAHSEHCVAFYNRLLSGTMEVSKLEANKNLRPLVIEQKGCIVTDVSQAARCCGKAAGVKIGDVIVGVEFRSFLNPDLETKYLPRKLHSFAKMSEFERMELLKRPATELRLLIERPNEDILQKSNVFLERVRKVNEPMTHALASVNSAMWFCRPCLARSQKDEGSLLPRMMNEAMLSRNLLRCLGADYYALPLHDEVDIGAGLDQSHQTTPKQLVEATRDDSLHVSLRRLDGMMTSIISHQSNPKGNDESTLSVPFNHPPRLEYPKGSRLTWALKELEIKPFELLCQGMRLLVSTTQGNLDVGHHERKRVLARNFVVLFSSWCDSSLSESFGTFLRPPVGAYCARVPWIRDGCKVCQVRQGLIDCDTDDCAPFSICGSQACQRILKMEHPDIGVVKNSIHPLSSTDLSLREYEERSSYVGATILILPGDPVLAKVQEKLGFNIEHNCRVVEFVVASYLPGFLKKVQSECGALEGCIDEEDGMFDLLPVLSQHQLQFLLHRCKMRKPPPTSQGDTGSEWLELDVLKLNGVLRLTPKDLRQRLDETLSINAAVEETLKRMAMGSDDTAELSDDRSDNLHDGNSGVRHDIIYRSLAEELVDGLGGFTVREKIFRSLQPSPKQNDVVSDKLKLSCLLCEIIDMLMPCMGCCGRVEDLEMSMSDASHSSDVNLQKGLDQTRKVQSHIDSSHNDIIRLRSKCAVLYSDLYFRSPEEKRMMKEALHGQPLFAGLQPAQVMFQSLTSSDALWTTVVLDREDALAQSKVAVVRKYTGPGWGLELLYWPNVDSNIRIGRVHPLSPAAAAGLRMHDIVVSINGLEVHGHKELVALAMINIWDASKKTLSVEELAVLFRDRRNAPLTPVVLVIRRPSKQTPSSPYTRSTRYPELQTREIDQVALPLVRGVDDRGVRLASSPPSARVGAKQSVNTTLIAHRGSTTTRAPPKSLNFVTNPMPSMNQIDRTRATGSGRLNFSESAGGSVRALVVDLTGRDTLEPTESPSVRLDSGEVARSGIWDACATLLLRVYSTAGGALQGTRTLSSRDLYRVSLLDVVFTTPETSVLIESARREVPKAGLGFLASRYDIATMKSQLIKLVGKDLSSIPRLPGKFWDFLVRKEKESNDSLHNILPIDRLLESFLSGIAFQIPALTSQSMMSVPIGGYGEKGTHVNQGYELRNAFKQRPTAVNENPVARCSNGEAPNSVLLHQIRGDPQSIRANSTNGSRSCTYESAKHPPQVNPVDPNLVSRDALSAGKSATFDSDLERIRGGGPDVYQGCRLLCECNYSEWPNKLVSGICDLLDDDTTNQTARFIGFVKDCIQCEGGSTSDLVQVSVFHLSSEEMNSYIQETEQVVLASMLSIVEEGSEEEKIAQIWWANQAAECDENQDEGGRLCHTPSNAERLVESTPLLNDNNIDSIGQIQATESSTMSNDSHNHLEVCNDAIDLSVQPSKTTPTTPDLMEFGLKGMDTNQSHGLHLQSVVQAIDGTSLPPSMDGSFSRNSDKPVVGGMIALSDARDSHMFALAENRPDEPEHDSPCNEVKDDGHQGIEFELSQRGCSNVSASTALMITMPIQQMSGSESPGPTVTSPILPKNSQTNMSESVAMSQPTNAGKELSGSASILGAELSSQFDFEGAARSLKDYLEQIPNGSLSPLGDLPDGREVFYVQSDPYGLYVRDVEKLGFLLSFHEENYRLFLRDAATANGNSRRVHVPLEGKVCCLWGCVENEENALFCYENRASLHFDSMTDLQDHIKQFHSYTTLAEKYLVGNNEYLWRIPQGKQLQKLLTDLSKAICSRCQSLLKFTEGQLECLREKERFLLQESRFYFSVADTWEQANGVGRLSTSVENVLQNLPFGRERVRALLTLWVRIRLLFNESDGWTMDSSKKGQSNITKRSSTAIRSFEGACNSEIWPPRSRLQGLYCNPCGTPSGQFQSWNLQSSCGCKSLRETGCALFSDFYQAESECVPHTDFREDPGLLGIAQALLLRVADNLPGGLKVMQEEFESIRMPGGNQNSGFLMWSQCNFASWRDFVIGCTSSRMLAQGFLVLVSSIQKSLLPSWWTSRGTGWLSAQALMFKPSLSKVLLHLYVFDAAVAEFVLTTVTATRSVSHTENIPASLALFPLEDRMAIVVKWADELNLPRFEGQYRNFCCKCDDGGELLCCEFCDAVQHPSCCTPPLQKDPAVFVCSVCTADVAALHEQS